LLTLGIAGPGVADAPGDFDYYVLSLSWNPSWCLAEGDARSDPACASGDGRGFTVHGLWPQFERGWPEFCRATTPDPTRTATAAMADIMGSAGLAWHQWRKHGRCSGLNARDYFSRLREAYARVVWPETLRALRRDVRIAPAVVEAAFVEANPGMTADGVTVTCREGLLREVRICLDRQLNLRACAPDAVRDCPATTIMLPTVR
jgi:ribonuclease T2